jgi:NAD+-dependent protein deacetylase sirtuin 6
VEKRPYFGTVTKRVGMSVCEPELQPETEEELRTKVSLLVEAIREAGEKGTVFFTGAGLSTSAGLADFRGPTGVWTKLLAESNTAPNQSTKASKSLEQFIPTFSHMAIVTLAKARFISGIISQNVDGLHMKSGLDRVPVFASQLPPHADMQVIELHGNCFVELCWACELEFIRDYDTCDDSQAFAGRCGECVGRGKKMCHCTPRRCLQ